MILRQDIIETAARYIGIPHVHMGRHPMLGLDCVGLVLRVCDDLGIAHHDLSVYSRVPDGSTLCQQFDRLVPEQHWTTLPAESGFTPGQVVDPKPGDMVMFWVKRPHLPTHIGIVGWNGQRRTLIHSDRSIGKCVQHHLNELWLKRATKIYNPPGLEPWPL